MSPLRGRSSASVPRLRRAALCGVLGTSREMGVEPPESVFSSVCVPMPGTEQGGMLEASPFRGTTTRRTTVPARGSTDGWPCLGGTSCFPRAYRGEGTSLSHLGNDRVSTATGIVCPTCGALLVQQHSLHNAAPGESPWIGQCQNQHWWLRSPVFGWMPIDPGAVAVDQAATPVQEE
jgi:hypothetical protein